MSLDFEALFGLGSCYRGAEWLRGELAAEPPGIREAVVRFGHLWNAKEWTVEERRGETVIIGAGGFYLHISTSAASTYHPLPWRRFTRDNADREILRRACFAIASLIGSPRAFYMHELLPVRPEDGLDLQALETQLRASFGAPSSTFEALAHADDFGPGCWYIDDFADLSAALSSRSSRG